MDHSTRPRSSHTRGHPALTLPRLEQGIPRPGSESRQQPHAVDSAWISDLNVPRGRLPHTFLTPKEFMIMVVEHWYAHRNIRELTGYETLFKSYTQSPTFAYEYARTLATVKQPFRTPEDAKDAHILSDTLQCWKLAKLSGWFSESSTHMARLDGIPAQQRQVEPVTYNTLPSMRLLISFSELPLTQDLFPILISLEVRKLTNGGRW
ncbi:hypothetical protein BDV97DRAFT_387645 [Delphinella strobiligena]|nr:hypothetical protein BDV97DRAFT_387645 [Delphinella strobiligena]